MIRWIDDFVNSITMYRLALYGLLVMAGWAVVLGFLGVLSFSGWGLIGSVLILETTCYTTNLLLSWLFKAPRNAESALITGMILFFLFLPIGQFSDLITLLLAGVISMASKYILAIGKKHILNPSAITAVLLGFSAETAAVWWVGTLWMLPVTLVVGLLIVRKLRRFRMFFSFMVALLVMTLLPIILDFKETIRLAREMLISWPIIFFACVMLTEPLTTPPTRKLQMVYGSLVGAVYASGLQFGPVYFTPEMSLVAGNIFSYLVSSKEKLFLHLQERKIIALNTYEFVFNAHLLNYRAGQYLEWTLPHHNDSRGSRRYFTIASSPTEDKIRLGVKIDREDASSFKRKLLNLKDMDLLVASSLAGDFTLSDSPIEKLVFIAGGIGITPFRSIVKYLMDKKERRDIVLFYANKVVEEIAYRDLLEEGKDKIGLRVVYLLSDKEHVPKDWTGKVGRLDEKTIAKEVPDYRERKFYLSGPARMVDGYKELLKSMRVSGVQIVTDYFPGF